MKTSQIYNENQKFEIGKAVQIGEGTDGTIFATGVTVEQAIKAQEELKKQNIEVRVVDIHTIKPIDKEMIVKCAKETEKLISIEDHSVIGGLGSAISEVLTEEYPVRLDRMGIKDTFGKSGKAEELMEYFEITAKDIVKSKAEEEHQEFELSDEFVSKYLDMDSFEELKKRTQEGIAATSNEAGMTKQEILLWRDLIKKKLAMQYTTDNYDQKKKELEDSLDQMAEEHQMNRKDFYEKYYDMTEEDTEAFVKKQAEKLTEFSDDVSEQAQGSEKQ